MNEITSAIRGIEAWVVCETHTALTRRWPSAGQMLNKFIKVESNKSPDCLAVSTRATCFTLLIVQRNPLKQNGEKNVRKFMS